MDFTFVLKWLLLAALAIGIVAGPFVYVNHLLSVTKVESFKAGYDQKTNEVGVATEQWMKAQEDKVKAESLRAEQYYKGLRKYETQVSDLQRKYAQYVEQNPAAGNCVLDVVTTGVWRSAALGPVNSSGTRAVPDAPDARVPVNPPTS